MHILLQSDDYKYKIIEFEKIKEIHHKDLQDDNLFLTKNIYVD